MSVILFGNEVFADVIKMGSYCSKVSPKSNMTNVFIRGKERHTEERQPSEDRGRDWNYADAKQGMPKATRSWKRPGGLLP